MQGGQWLTGVVIAKRGAHGIDDNPRDQPSEFDPRTIVEITSAG